jgi:hypothetical protein
VKFKSAKVILRKSMANFDKDLYEEIINRKKYRTVIGGV